MANINYTLHCLCADGSPHPLYPATDGWPSDPLAVRRPIVLMASELWEKGGAKEQRKARACSQTVAEQKREPLALHLPIGTAEVVVKNEKGYCAHYAIDAPEGEAVLLPVPGYGDIGASVCADRNRVGWRCLWFWDVFPGVEPDSEEGTLRASVCVCAARDAGLLPGLKTDGYRIMGANLRPAFATLLQPRVKPALVTAMKPKKGRRR
jgi:hypothetical protein